MAHCDIGVDALSGIDPIRTPLLIVLGGPIGLYEAGKYPFLTGVIALLAQHLSAGLPTLGICLGAQLMARALSARVYPGPAAGLTNFGENKAQEREKADALVDLQISWSIIGHVQTTKAK